MERAPPRRSEEWSFNREEDRAGRVFDWLVVLGAIVSVLIFFLAFAQAFIDNATLSYAIFLVALIIIAVLLARVVLPRPSPYVDAGSSEGNDHRRRGGKGVADQALAGQVNSQLTLYMELKTALLVRVKTRRRIPDDIWQKVLNDPEKLKALIQEKELYQLSQIDDLGTQDLDIYKAFGLVFGEGFLSCFRHLLKKVEGWR